MKIDGIVHQVEIVCRNLEENAVFFSWKAIKINIEQKFKAKILVQKISAVIWLPGSEKIS